MEYVGTVNKKPTVVKIPATVTINGNSYKITGIAANAFKNNKKLTEVTIGKNVITIGNKAFGGIHSKAVIKVPKKK